MIADLRIVSPALPTQLQPLSTRLMMWDSALITLFAKPLGLLVLAKADALKKKNQHWNGAGSDRAATVREAFPASPIWRLEERVGTGAFEACLQGQHWGSGDLPVIALLVSEGVASPQHQKLVRGGSPESRFKRNI